VPAAMRQIVEEVRFTVRTALIEFADAQQG